MWPVYEKLDRAQKLVLQMLVAWLISHQACIQIRSSVSLVACLLDSVIARQLAFSLHYVYYMILLLLLAKSCPVSDVKGLQRRAVRCYRICCLLLLAKL